MIGTFVAAAALASCAPPAPGGTATQLVTVIAARQRVTYASLALWSKERGCWRKVAGPWTARVGRNGLSAHHREGDGTTPTGTYGFGSTMYGIGPDPGVRFRYHRLVCGDWWDAEPASPTYNTFRHIGCETKPSFGGDSEALWKYTRAYRRFAVIDYNAHPIVPGRGSAMFLHEDTGSATSGCISLPPTELVHVLRWLGPTAAPVIVIRA